MRLSRTLNAALLAGYLTGCGAAPASTNEPAGPAVLVPLTAAEDAPPNRPASSHTRPRLGLAGAGIEPGPVDVIALLSIDADDEAEALTKALRAAVREMPRWAGKGWSLAPSDTSLDVLELSLRCSDPPDTSCQAQIADKIKSDKYIWGTLQKKKSGRVGGMVHLWVRGKGTSAFALDDSSNLVDSDGTALRRLATEALQRLLAGFSP